MINQNSAALAGHENDIAQRLRDRAGQYEPDPEYMVDGALNRAAADEIERLRAELCKLRAPVAEPAIVGWRDPDCGRMAQKGPPHGYNRYSEALMTVAEHRALMAAALANTPVAGEAVNADFLASWEAQRHAGNEWADMATNGIQWMRNVKDGISTPEKALECLASDLAHCRATQARAGITPPAAPQASARDALTPPADVAELVAFIFDRFGQTGDAGALPDNVVAAVRRLERGIKAQADRDGEACAKGDGNV